MIRSTLLASFLLASSALAQPLTNAFTYQGDLRTAGQPAQGLHDLRFRLYDAAAGGAQVGATLCADNISVADGRFIVSLDFGAVFAGSQRFLEIEVRQDTGLSCGNTTGFTVLAARQPLSASPYAAYSMSAGSAISAATASNATNLNGQPASFYTNATNLSAGTIADARLASTVARTNVAQTFTGAMSFSNAANSFAGSGAGLTGLSASNLATGTVADARLPTNLARLTTTNAFTATNTFASRVGIGTTTPTYTLDVQDTGGFPFRSLSSSTGGTWATIHNSAAGGHEFNLIATGPGNSEGAGKLLLRDGTASAIRLTIDGSGNVGVGAIAPSSLLELRAADPQLRIRNNNDTGGGVILNTFGSLQLGMFNPSINPWGAVPAGGYRAVLALDTLGRVGSVTNTSAGPAFRNLLDDGSGYTSVFRGLTVDADDSGDGTLAPGALRFGSNSGEAISSNRTTATNQWGLDIYTNSAPRVSITNAGNVGIGTQNPAAKLHVNGAIAATNLPAIKFSKTDRDVRDAWAALIVLPGQNADVEAVTVQVPGPGYLYITAMANVSYFSQDPDIDSRRAYLKLEETTSGSGVRLTEVAAGVAISATNPLGNTSGNGVVSIHWPIAVQSAGSRSFKINVYNDTSDWCRVWTTALVVTYYPQGL